MLFSRFFERRRREQVVSDLYIGAVEQARRPAYYTAFGVPDTLEGRYDMIILHVWMVLRRLTRLGQEPTGRALIELMFADMDRNLREMGVTDLRVGKRVLNMAEAFYGRAGAYDKALGEGEAALTAALERNVYQSAEKGAGAPAALARHIQAQLAHLDALDEQAFLQGRVSYLPPEVAS